jgi:hypothetical protein
MSSCKTNAKSYKTRRLRPIKRMKSSGPKLKGKRKLPTNVFKANFSVIKPKKQKNS